MSISTRRCTRRAKSAAPNGPPPQSSSPVLVAFAQELKAAGGATMGVFIYLDDVDKHYEIAKAAGAEIVHPPKDAPYGRNYWANDPEGHPWFFTTPPDRE